MRSIVIPAAALAVFAHAALVFGAPAAKTRGTVIVGATIVDGTGTPGRAASVRVEGDRISAIGDLKPAPGDAVVKADGLVLSPGFIDTHSHHEGGLARERGALAAASQGITTIVAGQDGGSKPLDRLFAGLDRRPGAVNVASYVGHGTIRGAVMGKDFRREATPAEVEKMKALVETGMKAGALGLASGLEYDPGIYSAPSEVVELAKVAARYGGRYISHIRSEDRAFWKAIDEIINIGREAKLPVQVSHMKLAMRSLWGQADKLIAKLDAARAEGIDITADVYPYTYWQSTLTVMFPDRNFKDRAAAEFAVSEVSTPEGLLLSAFGPDPTYIGKTIADIAKLRGTDPAQTLMDLIDESSSWGKAHPKDEDSAEGVIGTSMDESDIARLFQWPHTNVCTDGEMRGRHPRGFGGFPRVLGRYVREQKVLPLETAVQRMTSLAAAHMGFKDRGTIAPGQFADLVLFDPSTVIDRATTKEPHATAVGIRTVWVNGTIVYDNGRTTGRFPGRALRRVGSNAR